ncbi:hypothetical protein [Acidisphaera sp. S103]|uniref:hypothetical protein n=1 Tax=Acidisphaera sp. S103 TaxID=1747223 RepID=UPI00131E4858|nr:hypothetical protein [Acidisphaera sp. S103]
MTMPEENKWSAPAEHPDITLASIAAVAWVVDVVCYQYSSEVSEEDFNVFKRLSRKPLTAGEALDCQGRIRRYRNPVLETLAPSLMSLAMGEPAPYWDDHNIRAPDENRIREIKGVPVFYSVTALLQALKSQQLPLQGGGYKTQRDVFRWHSEGQRKKILKGKLTRLVDGETYADNRYVYSLHKGRESCGYLAARLLAKAAIETVIRSREIGGRQVSTSDAELARLTGLPVTEIRSGFESPAFSVFLEQLSPGERDRAENGEMVFLSDRNDKVARDCRLEGLWLYELFTGPRGAAYLATRIVREPGVADITLDPAPAAPAPADPPEVEASGPETAAEPAQEISVNMGTEIGEASGEPTGQQSNLEPTEPAHRGRGRPPNGTTAMSKAERNKKWRKDNRIVAIEVPQALVDRLRHLRKRHGGSTAELLATALNALERLS